MISMKNKRKKTFKEENKIISNRFIYETFDKDRISSLPQVLFEGRIVVVETAESAQKCVDYLLQQPIIGFDTETRPSFKKGISYKVSLLQLSTYDECFLFRLNKMGFPQCLVDILSNNEQLKVGLSLSGDFSILRERCQFTPGRFIDLQNYVGLLGVKDMSLQKLYANVFGKRISKTVRLSNWESSVLSEAQKKYAATDAWACLKLYEEINRLDVSHEFCFVPQVNLDKLLDDVIKEMLNEV